MGPTVKDSPPSSPQLENIGGVAVGKRKRKSNDSSSSHTQHILQQSANMMPKQNMHANEEKDIKVFQNNVSAPHMLGNQLNPSSTMAQKMSDTLSQELEAHSIFTESGNTSSNLIGPPLVNRAVSADKSATSTPNPTNSFSTIFSTNNGGQNSMLGNGAIPQTLDQLLERQWEQGSQFLMEQAQHFDIASLLSCLHQLRAENLRLEDHVNSLLQRRDHLLAVNARLAIPLTSVSNTHNTNTVHANINSQLNIPNSEMQSTASNISKTPRDSRVNTNYMMHTSTSGHSSVVTDNKPNIQNNVSTEPLLRQQYSQRPTSNPSQQNSNIRY